MAERLSELFCWRRAEAESGLSASERGKRMITWSREARSTNPNIFDRLTAWLLDACGLEQDHIIRHYDVTGKDCPRYFVANEQAWEQFKMDAAEADWL